MSLAGVSAIEQGICATVFCNANTLAREYKKNFQITDCYDIGWGHVF